MIPVQLAKEPPAFDKKVREPGNRAIAEMVGKQSSFPRVRGKPYKKIANCEKDIPPNKFPPLWKHALPDMLIAYEHRCAYLAMHIHNATGNPSVDHVVPKSRAWELVYEWDNYRLCAQIINSLKGNLETLVDPTIIGPLWFQLNLITFHVEIGNGADPSHFARIEATLPILNHRLCVAEREEYVHNYRLGPGNGGIDLAYLEKNAPFIASELRRQDQLQLVRNETS